MPKSFIQLLNSYEKLVVELLRAKICKLFSSRNLGVYLARSCEISVTCSLANIGVGPELPIDDYVGAFYAMHKLN